MPTKNIINGHSEFLNEFKKNEELFLELAEKGQKPEVLWIGCSDSRVTPNLITNTQPGELFIIRNIANIIPPESAKNNCTASVLKYAVNHLKVKHIVVCGHTKCGGMQALFERNKSDQDCPIHSWLDHAESAKDRLKDSNSNLKDLVELNVLLQEEHLLTFDFISEKVNNDELKIHKWIYDLNTGKISSYDELENIWIELSKNN